MAKALSPQEIADLQTPDQNYACVKMQLPEDKAKKIVWKITTDAPSISHDQSPDADFPGYITEKFDCTFPTDFYYVIRVGKKFGKKVRAKYPSGGMLYCTSSLATDFSQLLAFQDYCEEHDMLSVKYRQNKEFQFSFKDEDLYLFSRYFAKKPVFGKFYACKAGVKEWRGRRFVGLQVLPTTIS